MLYIETFHYGSTVAQSQKALEDKCTSHLNQENDDVVIFSDCLKAINEVLNDIVDANYNLNEFSINHFHSLPIDIFPAQFHVSVPLLLANKAYIYSQILAKRFSLSARTEYFAMVSFLSAQSKILIVGLCSAIFILSL